jgi:hypothetical protein
MPGPIAVVDAVQSLRQQWRGHNCFEASSPSTFAHGSLVVDYDVADLASGEMITDEKLAADDDTGTDATTDADE